MHSHARSGHSQLAGTCICSRARETAEAVLPATPGEDIRPLFPEAVSPCPPACSETLCLRAWPATPKGLANPPSKTPPAIAPA